MPVTRATSSSSTPRRNAWSTRSKRSAVGIASALRMSAGAAGSSGVTSRSRERSALRKASLKVRPMAITSPTLFMCVVSSRSASGNFSNDQRGHLTTT